MGKKLMTDIDLMNLMSKEDNVVIERLYPFKYKHGHVRSRFATATYDKKSERFVFGAGVSVKSVRMLLSKNLVRQTSYGDVFVVYELIANPVYSNVVKEYGKPIIRVECRGMQNDELHAMAAEYFCTIEYNAPLRAFKLKPMNGKPFKSPYIQGVYRLSDLDSYEWECAISKIVENNRG